MINVTKSFLPPLDDYIEYLKGIWEREQLTNNGPLVTELEMKLKNYLEVANIYFVNNGTTALQIAFKALEIKGDVITTPFSYVATCSSLVWENANPVFVDINPNSFTIDAEQIESAITTNTSAILATHVYGIPCEVETIEAIAKKHHVKVIYDAAHAFGVKYKGNSILKYGDISTLSFHATKLFHTVEGGALITDDDALGHKISYMRNFGHKGQEEFWGLGINGKNSEFHAAMGLCLLPNIPAIIDKRRKLSECYDNYLSEFYRQIQRPIIPDGTEYNYAYYPIVFENTSQLLMIKDGLNASYIYPRRYFYPPLHKLPYFNRDNNIPVAESISSRVLCLPLYFDLDENAIKKVCEIIIQLLKYKNDVC